MQHSPTRVQVALVLLLGLLWGLNWPTVKIALAEIGPWTLRASALCIAAISLVAFTWARGGALSIRRAHWWRIGVPAVLTIAAPNVLIAHAQLSAPTGRIAVVVWTMPVWATIFARFLLGERFDARRVLALALGVAGLIALGWPLVVAGEVSVGLAGRPGHGCVNPVSRSKSALILTSFNPIPWASPPFTMIVFSGRTCPPRVRPSPSIQMP